MYELDIYGVNDYITSMSQMVTAHWTRRHAFINTNALIRPSHLRLIEKEQCKRIKSVPPNFEYDNITDKTQNQSEEFTVRTLVHGSTVMLLDTGSFRLFWSAVWAKLDRNSLGDAGPATYTKCWTLWSCCSDIKQSLECLNTSEF